MMNNHLTSKPVKPMLYPMHHTVAFALYSLVCKHAPPLRVIPAFALHRSRTKPVSLARRTCIRFTRPVPTAVFAFCLAFAFYKSA